ncbi:D-glucuronyl C5-epimerase family protein [Streptomyces sp. NPDC057638]|uniref:D-glucuronyl C5-epimerase family protein n=1 Tax=Streptomyces sp. NPDC057638 TaxID=3346190 RepID=UPI0036742406
MPENTTSHIGRRRFMAVTGGVAAATVAGGTFAGAAQAAPATLASAPADLAEIVPGMPRSLALSLPATPAGIDPYPLPELPTQLEGGIVSEPSIPRSAMPYTRGPVDEAKALAAVPNELPFSFKTSGYTLQTDIPEPMRPWRDRPTRWTNVTPNTNQTYLDRDGVIQFRMTKTAPGYDHPVAQAQFGLGCLASYRVETIASRKKLFLTRAKAQAKRLIDRRMELRGAWFFPYPFDYKHTKHSGIDYKAPWFSGMAQGEVLSLFVQLAQCDGVTSAERKRYLAAAHGAFASLLLDDSRKPWAVNKDKNGYLWIQEYPGAKAGTGDYTFNGMIFAMFGLWDYYEATGNELAAKLYDGSVTTMRDHFSRLRNTRWLSYYCHTHRIPGSTAYHQHHINQWRQMHWHTGSAQLAHQHDQLVDDYPIYPLRKGSVAAIAAGSHTLYQLDTKDKNYNYDWDPAKQDKQLATKKVTFRNATQAPVSTRRRIQGRGIYYRIDAGAYAGWWIGESYPKVFLRGEHVTAVYRPQRTASFPANEDITCVKYGPDGTTGATKTVSFPKPSNAPFDRRAIVNGRPMIRITAGGLNGYWAPTPQVRTDGR